MEDEREKKQIYLRNNVLEAGHDVEKFIAFMGSRKTDGESIDNWKFDELKDVIQSKI
jgi:hypothetical protein